jgi:hypothetical protein
MECRSPVFKDNPNVGRAGQSASKKWIGKLVLMPPSENQQRTGAP